MRPDEDLVEAVVHGAPARDVASADAAVIELMAMGFEAAKAREMLALAGGDVEAAVALLCS